MDLRVLVAPGRLRRSLSRRLCAWPWRLANWFVGTRLIGLLSGRRYNAKLRRHRALLPALDDARSTIACALHARGVAQTTLRSLGLPGSVGMFESALKLVRDRSMELRRQASSGVDFLTVPAQELAATPEIYRFGLNPGLLDLIENYIGLPLAYDGVTLQYTVADGREVSTRRWHRDREDRRMIKLAIYLTDVDADGGPFQLLVPSPSTRSGGYRDGDFYLNERDNGNTGRGGRFEDIISCEGAAGTVIFADTARYFHRGKPATAGDRAALFFSYFARNPQRPYFCERTGLARRDVATLVENMEERQRASALWQQRLPWQWRYIPPAAL
jgi:hypothetical protein